MNILCSISTELDEFVVSVNLDKDLAERLLARMDDAKEAYDRDTSFYNLCYWDSEPEFVESCEELESVTHDWMQGAFTKDFPTPCIDCLTLHVTETRAWWSGYIKHTSVPVETAQITDEMCEKAVG